MKKKRKIDSGTQRIRGDIAHDRFVTFGYGRSSIPGCCTFEMQHHDLPYPIALVWFRFCRNATEIEILNSFTEARYRRCGLRTRINQELFNSYPTVDRIIADCGSADGGEAFMKARGYRKLPNHKGWELRRKPAALRR